MVVVQEEGVTQRLVAAKSRLEKKGLTIPQLELVTAYIVTNFLTDVNDALNGFPFEDLHAKPESR